jgi:hypothetical protein
VATIKELWFENLYQILEESRGLTKDQVNVAFLERAFQQGVSAAEAAAQVPLRGSQEPSPVLQGIETFAPPIIPQPNMMILKGLYWIFTVLGFLLLIVGGYFSLRILAGAASMVQHLGSTEGGGLFSPYFWGPLWNLFMSTVSGCGLIASGQLMACLMNWWVKNRDTSNPR